MSTGEGAGILLVEDEPGVRELLREHLSLRRYRCIEAKDGAEALQMLQTEEPDVILTDITMPGMSGVEFVLKSRALGCTVPIILLTGSDDSGLRALARDVGALYCISKPPDYDQLDRVIRASLAASRPG